MISEEDRSDKETIRNRLMIQRDNFVNLFNQPGWKYIEDYVNTALNMWMHSLKSIKLDENQLRFVQGQIDAFEKLQKFALTEVGKTDAIIEDEVVVHYDAKIKVEEDED